MKLPVQRLSQADEAGSVNLYSNIGSIVRNIQESEKKMSSWDSVNDEIVHGVAINSLQTK